MKTPACWAQFRAVAIIAAATACIVPPAAAQDVAENDGTASTFGTYAFQGVPVSAILVHAPSSLFQPATEAVSVRVGAPFEIADMRRSLQNIYSLGAVSDVQVSGREAGGGVFLEFTVLPAAHLHDVRFAGGNPVRTSILEDALTIAPGDRITRQMLRSQADRVQQALSDRGYERANVEPELVLDDTGLEGTVIFHLAPGFATRLRRLEFVGDLGIEEAEVREAFGLAVSGVYRARDLADGIDRLLRRLAEARFFHASVEIGPEAIDLNENTRDLQVIVTAGPRVELNLTGWDRGEEELRELLPFFEQTTVADWILNQARDDIIAELQRQGYWKPLVAFGRERDPEGRNVAVSFTIIPARNADIETIDISGNEHLSTEAIREQMQTAERRLLRGAPFLSRTWEQDQRNILELYRRSGFLQARITEASVSYDERIDGLHARLEIDEGERTIVGQVTIDTQARLATRGIDASGWGQEIQLRTGGPYDPDALRRDETRLRILLANLGFRRAKVSGEVHEQADPYSVSIAFTIVPGQRVRVGQLLISGNKNVREEVIRRQLSLVPGSPYTQQSVILSQSRLYQLGLFSRVDIDTARPHSTETEPTVVVRVEEGSSRRLSWGLGYSTEEQVRGLVVVGEENLWGRNHRATFSVRSSFAEQRARFIYTDPYLLGRDVEGAAVTYFESIDREGFKAQSFGTSFQLVKRHSATLTSVGRYAFRNQQTFDVLIDENLLEPEDRDVVVGSLTYTLLSDTRPNPINPRSGGFHTIDLEWAASELGSESDYVKMFGRSYWYWEMPDSGVLVAAARAGFAVPYGSSFVPLPERFFAGGSTTLRGFGRNRAGPTDEDANPLGGDVLLIANLEYRFPIRGDLGAVLFADVGNVFAGFDAVSFERVRETVGIGVRYETPIGPLRLDWGYLLDARAGEDGSRLHFAIGQAF